MINKGRPQAMKQTKQSSSDSSEEDFEVQLGSSLLQQTSKEIAD